MKISAIDIRKHTFEKIFRGYDPDAVDAFLNSLSQEWERYTSENRQLKTQLEQTEKELAKLKDIESSLFRTLKTAEETGRQIEREALEEANQKIEISKAQADDMVQEAEQRTQQIVKDTEMRLQQLKEDFLLEIKNQERDFRAIENYRDNLIVQLSSLANNTMETVERFEQKYDKESVISKLEDIKKHVATVVIPSKEELPVAEGEGLPEPLPVSDLDPPLLALTEEGQKEAFSNGTEADDHKAQDIVEAVAAQPVPPSEPDSAEMENKSDSQSVIPEEDRQGQNKFRNPEPIPPKEQSGGSFFDQI
ncbi:DivIVA domain-containing protein [Dyadobacter tibetensis]|uniref:DivIVA domain-containing protein n=1 Tax=Dyadobacter tibetensis TaxID=1211851 RepID=UPI00046EA900|nr:DivIVA domain-containing protein [Dyadobacter tibetensis]